MKRGGPLVRRTPLSQGSKGLSRGAPLARTPMKRAAPETPVGKPRPPRDTGPTAAVRALVKARDRGRCVRCEAPGTNVHHRVGRGAGGRGKADAARTNGPEWLLTLCGFGNASKCHQAVDTDRAAAEADGYVIRRNGLPVDAALVPVRTARGLERFTADGRREPL